MLGFPSFSTSLLRQSPPQYVRRLPSFFILHPSSFIMPPKRKRGRITAAETNPDINGEIFDGKSALRASPDADGKGEAFNVAKLTREHDMKQDGISDLDNAPQLDTPSNKKPKRTPTKASLAAKKGSDEIKAFKAEQAAKKAVDNVKMEDGDDQPDEVEDLDTERREAGRPPPVNSDYLPLPWTGRLGYVGGVRIDSIALQLD